jgi:hypothetical protein
LSLWRLSMGLGCREGSNSKHNRDQNLFHQYGSLGLWGLKSEILRETPGESPCIPGLPDYKYLCFRRQASSRIAPRAIV